MPPLYPQSSFDLLSKHIAEGGHDFEKLADSVVLLCRSLQRSQESTSAVDCRLLLCRLKENRTFENV